ncbi:tetratricopeptide repeat protein [Bacteroidales bacterium OttesenSCG-928-I14]|nr:tetratricopeptide repeat protein [Bacteroidales bacterium OttesenSCG-928-I14]
MAMIEEEAVPYLEKEKSFDSILFLSQETNDDALWAEYSYKKMKFSFNSGKYLESYKTGVEIITKYETQNEKIPDSIDKNEVLLYISRCCTNLDMYDEGVSYLKMIIQDSESKYIAEAYSQLGFIFMMMNQLEKAKEYHEQSLELLNTSNQLINKKANIYNNIAGYYYINQQTDSALYYLNKSLELYDSDEKNAPSKGFIYNNMAMIYQSMDEYTMAKNYYSLAIEIAKNEPYTYAGSVKNMASLLLEYGKLDEAEKYYLEALDAANKVNAMHIKDEVLIELSEIYYKKKQYQTAWEHLKEGVTLRDSVINKQNSERVFLLSQQLSNYKFIADNEALERNLQLARSSNEKNKIIIQFTVLLLIILIVVTLFLFKYFSRRSSERIKIESQRNEKEMKKKFDASLEEKSRKLASNALHLMNTDEIISHLERYVRQLGEQNISGDQKILIEKMENELASYNSAKGWDEFKFYFEEVHHSFYTKLNKANPNLTKMEQRLCALLVLNMNTKEIAQITNRSVRTIETLIYKLRKSLNIPSEEKTVNFLRKFLEE